MLYSVTQCSGAAVWIGIQNTDCGANILKVFILKFTWSGYLYCESLLLMAKTPEWCVKEETLTEGDTLEGHFTYHIRPTRTLHSINCASHILWSPGVHCFCFFLHEVCKCLTSTLTLDKDRNLLFLDVHMKSGSVRRDVRRGSTFWKHWVFKVENNMLTCVIENKIK